MVDNDGPIQVRPMAGYSDVGFIDPPGPVRMAQFAANSLAQEGGVPLDPTPDGCVVEGKTALRHELLYIP